MNFVDYAALLLLVSMTECLTFTICVQKSKLIETLINYTTKRKLCVCVCVTVVVTSHGWLRVVRDLIQWKIQTVKVAFEQWQWGDGFNRSLVLSLFCSNQQLTLWLPQNIAQCTAAVANWMAYCFAGFCIIPNQINKSMRMDRRLKCFNHSIIICGRQTLSQ